MLKAIRYTLAAICLAASVGCLALWGWSYKNRILVTINYPPFANQINTDACCGQMGVTARYPVAAIPFFTQYQRAVNNAERDWRGESVRSFGRFRVGPDGTIYFPLWYPALVFALAAVLAIRVRRFTLRSALVATSVVAALLVMVVAL